VSGRDHRATVRVALVAAATVAPLHDLQIVHPVETVDISPAGVALLMRESLPIGTRVRFRCEIPGRRQPVPVDVEGTIRWHREVLANHTVLGRDAFHHYVDFAPLASSVEDAIVSALFFIETKRSMRCPRAHDEALRVGGAPIAR
jgi:hypothetical protein